MVFSSMKHCNYLIKTAINRVLGRCSPTILPLDRLFLLIRFLEYLVLHLRYECLIFAVCLRIQSSKVNSSGNSARRAATSVLYPVL